jgi:succinyl-CoA synthetase beta subunit
MKLHEYQAKELFDRYGIAVPKGIMVTSSADAEAAAAKAGTSKVVVKAQVHVGGRGKAGGVKVVDKANVKAMADQILGMDIKGLTVNKVLIDPAIDIKEEYYASFTLDRAAKRHVLIISAAGGVDIEEVAEKTPEKVVRLHIDPLLGLKPFDLRYAVKAAGFPAEMHAETIDILTKLYKLYVECDCNLAEINPLVRTGDGKVLAADAKVDIDDNADFRHPDFEAYRDLAEENPNELKAKAAGLSYIQLEGDIGCVVNGAGLAMATMDMVKHFGGQPANFLDIGGSSNPQKVTTAMEILQSIPELKAILFNIFGGITRCDDVAKGLVTALKASPSRVPIVIRLTGTNEAEGRKILEENGLVARSIMAEAVQEAIKAAGGQPALAGR